MTRHLTDIACLEWVRRRSIELAPETTFGVETHLAGCQDCRDRVADFEALERAFHPYGSPLRAKRGLLGFFCGGGGAFGHRRP